jgi:hypothetical protein
MAPALPVLAAIGAAVGVSVLVWRKWGDQITLAVRAATNVIRERLEPVVTFVRAFASRVAEAFRWFRDNALKPVRDFVLRVGEWLIDRLGPIIQRVAQIVGRVARALNPALGAALDAVADFVDDTRKEMIRLRGSVEDETGAATQALGDFKQALSDFSQEELEITATGLGRNLIEAEKELDATEGSADAGRQGIGRRHAGGDGRRGPTGGERPTAQGLLRGCCRSRARCRKGSRGRHGRWWCG